MSEQTEHDEFNYEEHRSAAGFYTAVTVSAISGTVCFVAAIYHLIKASNMAKAAKKPMVGYRKWLNLTTTATLICSGLFCFSNGFVPLVTDKSTCSGLVGFPFLTYDFAKYFLYTTLLLRVQLAFKDSIFAYPKAMLYTIHVINFLVFIVFRTIFDLALVKPVIYELDFGRDSCTAAYPNYGSIIVVGLDIIEGFFSLFLFTRPLIKLMKTDLSDGPDGSGEPKPQNSVTTQVDDEIPNGNNFGALVIKNAILTFLMIISTCLMIGIASVGILTVIFIDAMVNSMCLLLMLAGYHEQYLKLFANQCCNLHYFFESRMNVKLQQKAIQVREDSKEANDVEAAVPR